MAELRLEEARMDRLDDVLSFVDGMLETLDCPMKTQMHLDIAVEELYVNIVRYAYAPGTGPAVLRMEPEAGGHYAFDREAADRRARHLHGETEHGWHDLSPRRRQQRADDLQALLTNASPSRGTEAVPTRQNEDFENETAHRVSCDGAGSKSVYCFARCRFRSSLYTCSDAKTPK